MNTSAMQNTGMKVEIHHLPKIKSSKAMDWVVAGLVSLFIAIAILGVING